MAVRQNLYNQPWRKRMSIFPDFTGGMNTVDVDEKLDDNEFSELKNVNIEERGSIRRREGLKVYQSAPAAGKGQGYFRYFKEGGTYEDILAVGGHLYDDAGNEITISGLSEFQTTRPIEAVQFGNILYIATGTSLVQYDGTEAKVVDPYKPDPLEALYIGTNGLADDPDNFMSNGTANDLRIDGVTFNNRYGVINENIRLETFVSKPDTMDVEFMYEQRTSEQREGFWETGRDWSTDPVYELKTDYQGDLQFRVWAREVGETDLFNAKQYLIPKYTVKPAPDPEDEEVPNDMIHSCNRIKLHWNRLILYGDEAQPDAIFISHLNNPRYFPVPNSLRFESKQRERITNIIKYRDYLVVFTPSTIQALFGKGPSNYQRVMVHSGIGCIADDSVQIMDNRIVFLSQEGVHIVKSFGYNEVRMNVEKIDVNIDGRIPKDDNATSAILNNQYHLLFPDSKQRFRCYYRLDFSWVYDESDKFDISKLQTVNGRLYAHSNDGTLFRFEEGQYNDDGYIYETLIRTKGIDFGQPYHDKKLKELHLILSSDDENTSLSTRVYSDGAAVVDTDTSYASVDETTDEVVWNKQDNPNVNLYGGTTFGDWVIGESPFGKNGANVYTLTLTGRCRQTQFEISHSEDHPIHVIGFGYIFKLKNP